VPRAIFRRAERRKSIHCGRFASSRPETVPATQRLSLLTGLDGNIGEILCRHLRRALYLCSLAG
jgi:hypothetical protein